MEEERESSHKVLPFGLRSAPLLFTALAEATIWMIPQKGVHYMDDFILAGEPHSTQCALSMVSALQAFHELGIPTEPDKSEGPATTLAVLGKLCRLQKTTASWRGYTKGELLSPSALLQHAATVTRPGQSLFAR